MAGPISEFFTIGKEGTYRLMTLSEYSRPNRVGYQPNQSSPQVRVSFVALPLGVQQQTSERGELLLLLSILGLVAHSKASLVFAANGTNLSSSNSNLNGIANGLHDRSNNSLSSANVTNGLPEHEFQSPTSVVNGGLLI